MLGLPLLVYADYFKCLDNFRFWPTPASRDWHITAKWAGPNADSQILLVRVESSIPLARVQREHVCLSYDSDAAKVTPGTLEGLEILG